VQSLVIIPDVLYFIDGSHSQPHFFGQFMEHLTQILFMEIVDNLDYVNLCSAIKFILQSIILDSGVILDVFIKVVPL